RSARDAGAKRVIVLDSISAVDLSRRPSTGDASRTILFEHAMNRRTDAPPTHEDAKLLLQLYEMRRDERLREARRWFAASFGASTFDELMKLSPPGTEENASYRMVTSYWELVASFITSGVLNQELFFQSGRELLFCWTRLRDLAPQVREK